MQFPSLFYTADAASLAGQREAKRLMAGQLIALIAASVFGSLSIVRTWRGTEVDIFAGGAFLFLVAALGISVWRTSSQPEQKWYIGRALAESVKSLSWLYAVGGNPFSLTTAGDADADFIERLRELAKETSDLDRPTGPVNATELTAEMRRLRAFDLTKRRDVYVSLRLNDQLEWYERKWAFNRARARILATFVALSVTAGLMVSGLGFFRVAPANLEGVATTVASGLLAWLQLNQHRTLVDSYRVANQDLRLARDTIPQGITEDWWAQFVSDAETAMSREHTMWLARREQRVLRAG